jgi:quercetin dioxygenase-like cupin family protein
MKRSVLAPALALAALALGGCATQSTATAAHHALAFGGPAARVVDFPSAVGPGQPREVRVLIDEPALKLVTIVLRQGTLLPEHSAPIPVTIQALQGVGTVIAGTERFRIDPTHAVVLSASVLHAVQPDPGTDLVLLVHHLGRGEESHP